MAEWRQLPDTLTPAAAQLVEELRRVKDLSGLGLRTLALRTHVSTSTWSRYLNGGTAPPLSAVLALARQAGADPARLTAMWHLADAAAREADGRGRSQSQDGVPGPPPAISAPSAAEDQAADAPSAAEDHAVARFAALVRWARRRPVVTGLAMAAAGAVIAAGAVAATVQTSSGPAPAPSLHALQARCHGSGCDGKDPKQMGCGGDAWTAAVVHVGGIYLEVRYSNVCRAAWARIQWAQVGDEIAVERDDGHRYRNAISYDHDAYTPMVGAAAPSRVRACGRWSGTSTACTSPGGTSRLPEPPDMPSPSLPSATQAPRAAR